MLSVVNILYIQIRQCFGWVLRRTNTVKVIWRLQVLLVEEDLGCLSVHYFRHEQAPE